MSERGRQRAPGDRPDRRREPEREREIRRILIAWDASPASREAIDAAVELALRHGASLTGLWVEEMAWAAGWTTTAGGSGLVTPPQLASIQAARGREAIERAAARHRLSWSFRVERGEVTERILAATAGHDVLALGRIGWSSWRGRRMGSTAATLIASSRGVLIPYEHDRTHVLLLLFGEERKGAGGSYSAGASSGR